MKILFLAPQPFFQERGTPIAVRLAAQVIASRKGGNVTLMTYFEGNDIEIPNVIHKRVSTYPKIKGIKPGFSFKKLYCDLFFFFAVVNELIKNRNNQYQLIHAVEESVFFAWALKPIFRVPFIYDMDSSLSLQLIEGAPILKPLAPFFRWLEAQTIKGSVAVVPVCDALDVIAKQEGAKRTVILRDIPLQDVGLNDINLRQEAGLSKDDLILLYVGNLEKYQGIELMIEGFAKIYNEFKNAYLIIIGGREEHIESYQQKTQILGVSSNVKLIGPRPVGALSSYLTQADILVSPRTLGNNTPMKIYSYIHSGIPVLATDLPTHTQVLDSEISELVKPTPEGMAKGMQNLLTSKEHRKNIAQAAKTRAEKLYTFEVFQKRLNELYDGVDLA